MSHPLRPLRRRARIAVAPVALLALLLVCSFGVAACGAGASSGSASSVAPVTLTVFAAASLTESFKEIGTAYHQAHSNVTTQFNFGGSQDLAQQINQGAAADVFASANQTQMKVVTQSGEVAADAPKVFARNRLVVIYPKDNPAHITQLQDLAKPNLRLVLADKSVPVGQYALTFLGNASKDPAFGSSYQANALKNVVSYENDVKAVLNKVALGEADAGVVYTTDAASAKAGTIDQLAIPDTLNVIATYPIAPLKGSKHAAEAQQFITYLVSADGQRVLQKYGFIAPSGA